MNMMQSSDPRMKATRENSIMSFNAAAKFPIDFIEFDVQVEKKQKNLGASAEFDGHGLPVIFCFSRVRESFRMRKNRRNFGSNCQTAKLS